MRPEHPILAGVPQGSAISPLLFNVFINDVPKLDSVNEAGSLLFADDLVTFCIYKEPGHAKSLIRKYMLEFESWLNKWRLTASASPNKCCFTIFTSNGKCSKEKMLEPILYKTKLRLNENPKLLGISFDKTPFI